MYNGIINIYKEAGYTSHDVVARLRGILGQKRIGHTGTLDPDAEGVLVVCLGSGTGLCELLMDKDKEYQARLLLGVETDTQDTSGKVLCKKEVRVSAQEVRKAAEAFVGDYDQVPPMYSALKVQGKKLYELAREGKEIERAARRVTIHFIRIDAMDLPYVDLTVGCSRGTYIRTLCQDLGKKLGCGGTMARLLRTRSGNFTKEQAWKLSEIEAARDSGRLRELILPVDAFFEEKKPVTVKRTFQRLTENGNPFYGDMTLPHERLMDGEESRVYGEDGRFYGIYAYGREERIFRPVKMFLEK